MYEEWKKSVIPQFIVTVSGYKNPDGVQCTNVSRSWSAWFSGRPWWEVINWGDAKDHFANSSDLYFTKIKNDGGPRPNITAEVGDIACYGATPADGYTNQYNNPWGHTGVVDGQDAFGYWLIQEDGSEQSKPTNRKYRRHDLSPLIGLLRPKLSAGKGAGGEEIEMLNDGDRINIANDLGVDVALLANYKTWNELYYALLGGSLRSNRPANEGDLKNWFDWFELNAVNPTDREYFLNQHKGSWHDLFYDLPNRQDYLQRTKKMLADQADQLKKQETEKVQDQATGNALMRFLGRLFRNSN
jgi:hypothetical protein